MEGPNRALRREGLRSELVTAARRQLLRGERVDVQRLAALLGVSRATAYRWVGNNDQLLAEALCSLNHDTFERAKAQAAGSGLERILDVFRAFLHWIASSEPIHRFVQSDPKLAMTIVTTQAYPIQRHSIGLVRGLLEEEAAGGAVELPLDAHSLAYAIVRLMEAFLYADIVAGEHPDPDIAVEIIALLFGAGGSDMIDLSDGSASAGLVRR